MATRNDITGDALISKTNSKEYEANWDRIFGKKKQEETFDEDRIDIIGQNGNIGYDDASIQE